MPEIVPDTPENMEICKKFFGSCPSFKPNGLNTASPMALFYARVASTKPAGEITDYGCHCPGCGVFLSNNLEGGWFCTDGAEGKKA